MTWLKEELNGKLAGCLYFWDPSRTTSNVWSFAPCARSSLDQVTEADLQATFCSAEEDEKGHKIFGNDWSRSEAPGPRSTAILLRFFEQHDFRTVGEVLGSNEDAARMRVTRALDKLATLLKRRGVTASSITLGVALGTNVVQAAPVGLAATISTAALSSGAFVTTTATAMKLINLKIAAAAVAAAALTGSSTYFVQEYQKNRLEAQIQTLSQDRANIVAERDQATAALKTRDDQISGLQNDLTDLPRLRGEVARLRRELATAMDKQKQPESSVPALSADPSDRAAMAAIQNRFQSFFAAAAAGNSNLVSQSLAVLPAQELSPDRLEMIKEAFVQEVVRGAAGLQSFLIQDATRESSNSVRLTISLVDTNHTARLRDMHFIQIGDGWYPALKVWSNNASLLTPHGGRSTKWETIRTYRAPAPVSGAPR